MGLMGPFPIKKEYLEIASQMSEYNKVQRRISFFELGQKLTTIQTLHTQYRMQFLRAGVNINV